MQKLVIYCLTPICLGTLVSNAFANDVEERLRESMYVSTFVGLNILDDIETDTIYSTTNDSYHETYMQDNGYSFRFAVGGNLQERLRGEIEFGINTSEQGSIREVINGGFNVNNYSGTGDIKTYTVLANIWADLELPENSTGAMPYFGGGIGLAYVDSDLVYPNTPTYGPQDSSVEFAAQLGVGVNWNLTDTTQFGVGYRLNFVKGPTTQQVTTPAGELTTYHFDDLLSHTFGISLVKKIN